MSEYQYYEWQIVDRLLTQDEQEAVNSLSSHIEVSPHGAVVTYDWGDFKHDPDQVLLEFFDAFFYLANWGTMRLMFRFPKGMLDEMELEPYLTGEGVSFVTVGEYQVLDIDFNPEDGSSMAAEYPELSDFIPLRADLLRGDYRLLYLAWLREMTLYNEPGDDLEDISDSPQDEIEPPVPAGLKKLSPALDNFVRAFSIDPFLVAAAAENSPDLKPSVAVYYREWITRLSREECNGFLTRLAAGDPVVGMSLRKRLDEFRPQDETHPLASKRTLTELLQRASQLKKAEKKRQDDEIRRQHIVEMKNLAKREPQVWQEVELLLDTGSKSASTYDQATLRLDKLKQLSEFQDTGDEFQAHIQYLASKYSARSSLISRWKARGWI
jgi:hypothetical protein